MRLTDAFLLTLLLLAALQTAVYLPQMPQTMATHFDGAGVPNGWSSRGGFAGLYWVMLALVAAIFWVMPRVRFGDKRMNIPHRDYWLAPERREATLQWMRDQMQWFGVVQLAFAVYVGQLVYLANLRPEPRLGGGVWWMLGAYFLYLAVWLARWFTRFRRVDRPAG